MKPYNELRAAIEVIQQMFQVTESERNLVLKEVKQLCKKFDFISPMSKDSFTKGQKA